MINQTIQKLKTSNLDTLRQEINNYWQIDLHNLKQVLILGFAGEGKRLASICKENNILIEGIFDDSFEVQNDNFENLIINKTEDLVNYDKNIPVIIASHRTLKAYKRMKDYGFKTVIPFMVLQNYNPTIFSPHMFHENLLEALLDNTDNLEKLVNMLADEKSKNVLDSIINYRLIGDPTILDEVVEWELYGPEEVFEYSDNETYVDAGTFDGDSIKLFINRVKSFNKVYGFEPDPKTFIKLENNFKDNLKVIPVNAGLYDKKTKLKFNDEGSRASIISETGNKEVDLVSLDDFLSVDEVTYIKMNIEGAESKALEGAKKILTKYKPKLAISLYHYSNDLWKLPFEIKKINPEYQFFIRQHDGGIIESVLFAK